MRILYSLIVISIPLWTFFALYCHRLDPESRVNRTWALACVYTAAWNLGFLLLTDPGDPAVISTWYNFQLFSLLLKGELVLVFSLVLSGLIRRRIAFTVSAVILPGVVVAAAGVLTMCGVPVLQTVKETAASAFGVQPSLRPIYAVLADGSYCAGFGIMAWWKLVRADRKGRRLANYLLAIGIVVITCNTLIGFVQGLPPLTVAVLSLLVQIAQIPVFVIAFRGHHLLKPTLAAAAREIIDSIRESVILVDVDGNVVSLNPATQALLDRCGETPAPDDTAVFEAEALLPHLENLRKGRSKSRTLEMDCYMKSGVPIPMRVKLSPVRTGAGAVTGFLLLGRPLNMIEEVKKEFHITEREKEIYLLLIRGYSNRGMAEKLFISPGTVKNHIHSIYDKTGAKNRVDLARLLE